MNPEKDRKKHDKHHKKSYNGAHPKVLALANATAVFIVLKYSKCLLLVLTQSVLTMVLGYCNYQNYIFIIVKAILMLIVINFTRQITLFMETVGIECTRVLPLKKYYCRCVLPKQRKLLDCTQDICHKTTL